MISNKQIEERIAEYREAERFPAGHEKVLLSLHGLTWKNVYAELLPMGKYLVVALYQIGDMMVPHHLRGLWAIIWWIAEDKEWGLVFHSTSGEEIKNFKSLDEAMKWASPKVNDEARQVSLSTKMMLPHFISLPSLQMSESEMVRFAQIDVENEARRDLRKFLRAIDSAVIC